MSNVASTPPWWHTLVNLLLFQVLWVCTVGGAGLGYWWAGLPVLAVFVGYQLAISRWPKADATLMVLCALLGGAADTLLLQMGLFTFAQPVPSAALAPIWIVVLWVGFSLTLNHSMAFFKTRPLLAAIFGLVGGPVAYAVASKVWKAVYFQAPDIQVYIALGIVWAIMTPLLLAVASNLVSRFQRPTAT